MAGKECRDILANIQFHFDEVLNPGQCRVPADILWARVQEREMSKMAKRTRKNGKCLHILAGSTGGQKVQKS